jgi:hypothetical protein
VISRLLAGVAALALGGAVVSGYGAVAQPGPAATVAAPPARIGGGATELR